MITYELALKLKNAGFPMKKHISSNGECGICGKYITIEQENELCESYFPSLSELIENCNPTQFDEFGISCGYHDQWEARAVYHGYAIPEVDLCIRGQTPEEAVANLWLALSDSDSNITSKKK